MHPKREKALRMRRQGASYNEIKAKLGIGKSTLSYMLKGITLTRSQQLRLKRRGSVLNNKNSSPTIEPEYTAIDRRVSKDEKGMIAEQAFVLSALRCGLNVFVPVNSQLRYDFLVEARSGKFLKVQVKSTWKHAGAYRAELSQVRRTGRRQVYEANEVDVFALYHPTASEFWLVPHTLVLRRYSIACRTEKCRGNQFGVKSWLYWKKWSIFDGV